MLAERIDMVVPAQLTPFFAASVGAYNHVRYLYTYFPSISDILVAFGVFALGIWMMMLAGKYLPLEVSPHKAAPQGGALS
jgi:Ni/Fe-hydrogenase subunit HybB-like protein